MTFSEFVSVLSKELGGEIETEGDTCAVRTDGDENSAITILIQGFNERNALLMTADLGQPPPECLERLYRTILEANDLFRDTCGATLSLNPATGNVRLQRFDLYDVLMEAGPLKALTMFASVAVEWSRLVRDYRDAPDDDEGKKSSNDSNLFGVRV